MDGWIKLHRSLLDDEVFCSSLLLKVFIWCLLRAGTEEKNIKFNNGFQTIHLMPGQFVTSRRKAAAELSMNESAVYRYMEQLEIDGCIKLEKTSSYTIVTVEKWAFYQQEQKKVNSNRTTTEQRLNNNRTATEHKQEEYTKVYSKEQKNKKKDNRPNGPLKPDEIDDSVYDDWS